MNYYVFMSYETSNAATSLGPTLSIIQFPMHRIRKSQISGRALPPRLGGWRRRRQKRQCSIGSGVGLRDVVKKRPPTDRVDATLPPVHVRVGGESEGDPSVCDRLLRNSEHLLPRRRACEYTERCFIWGIGRGSKPQLSSSPPKLHPPTHKRSRGTSRRF